MPYPHVIRLRGPWGYEVLQRDGAARGKQEEAPAKSGRIKLPADWGSTLGVNFRGRVRYRRRFNRPTGLEPHERVWLVIGGADARGEAMLNGRALGAIIGYAVPAAFDVTEQIEDRNELAIDVELPARSSQGILRPGREHLPGGLIGEVRLEIRQSTWIDHLRLEAIGSADNAQLVLTGKIAGATGAKDLAMAVTVDGREVLFHEAGSNEDFSIAAQLAAVKAWAPTGGQRSLSTVAIHLLDSGTAVWETERAIACRPIVWNESARILTVAGDNLSLPVPPLVFEPGRESEQLVEFLQSQQAPCLFPTERILDEDEYQMLDAAGVCVLQAMPAEWASWVCPRLAHHPSIVAWVGELSKLEQEASPLSALDGGRPWIDRRLAFV